MEDYRGLNPNRSLDHNVSEKNRGIPLVDIPLNLIESGLNTKPFTYLIAS